MEYIVFPLKVYIVILYYFLLPDNFLMRHSNSSAFTLAEILVIMVIIAIIALWSSTLNFNKMSQKQQLDIEMQKIVNIIEETRNNALLGKSIWNTNQAPTFWRVDISASGSTESLYSTDGINYTSYLKSQILHPLVAIRDLRCDRVDMTPGDAPFFLEVFFFQPQTIVFPLLAAILVSKTLIKYFI